MLVLARKSRLLACVSQRMAGEAQERAIQQELNIKAHTKKTSDQFAAATFLVVRDCYIWAENGPNVREHRASQCSTRAIRARASRTSTRRCPSLTSALRKHRIAITAREAPDRERECQDKSLASEPRHGGACAAKIDADLTRRFESTSDQGTQIGWYYTLAYCAQQCIHDALAFARYDDTDRSRLKMDYRIDKKLCLLVSRTYPMRHQVIQTHFVSCMLL